MTVIPDLRHANARELAEVLQGMEFSREQLQLALANALERIAVLEENWDGLGEIFRAFHEQMSAARVHGAGLLKDQ